jgi:energy-coupling factor transporter ATP-binding protein EcfA2
MAIELIRRLLEVRAFNPTPIGDQLIEFYVPFDDLLGGDRIERALGQAMMTGTRVAVVGPSGSGKSSLCEWVLGVPGGEFAATRIPVAIERDETVTDPQAFAQHVIRLVSGHAAESALISAEEREAILRGSGDHISRPGREITKRAGIGLPDWLLRGELAREVTSYMESIDQPRSTTTILEALEYLIGLIAHHGLQPVFVIDDSDAWLNIEGVRDRSALVNEFFGRVLRMMAELPCGLVVAVHTDYLGTAGYRQAEGFLEQRITIPELPDGATIAALLDRRIKTCDEAAGHHDVIDEAAIEALFNYYQGAGARSLRKVLQTAQTALGIADETDGEIVTSAMVESAISEWN